MAHGLCRITGDPLEACIDLGEQFLTDFVDRGHVQSGTKGSLKLGIGPSSGVVQLFDSVPPESMYRRYWYRSGINDSMRAELRSIVESAMSFVRVRSGDTVLDIASNDGTLLSYYPGDLQRIGIDPSNVAAESELYGGKIRLVNDFFSRGAYESATSRKAKVVTVIAMFYDLEDPAGFLRQVRDVMDDRGLLIIQLSYTPLMLEQNEFGNICHEHVCYYTLTNLLDLLRQAGFEVVDAEVNATNGGSVRVYATPVGGVRHLDCPLNWLSIGHVRVKGLLEYERQEQLHTPGPYQQFMARVEQLKHDTLSWLHRQAELGKLVVGYGASTKGNTLLQYYGITSELLPCIAEANMKKWGLCTVGTGIPIVSEDEMRKMKPDYLFVLPWFFTSYFMERERELLERGTKLVMPQPELCVVNSDRFERAVPEPRRKARAA